MIIVDIVHPIGLFFFFLLLRCSTLYIFPYTLLFTQTRSIRLIDWPHASTWDAWTECFMVLMVYTDANQWLNNRTVITVITMLVRFSQWLVMNRNKKKWPLSAITIITIQMSTIEVSNVDKFTFMHNDHNTNQYIHIPHSRSPTENASSIDLLYINLVYLYIVLSLNKWTIKKIYHSREIDGNDDDDDDSNC